MEGIKKGYKGFSKGLICRGKQYAENTVFEENEAVICSKGMHFCENPLDVLDHYGFMDSKGNLNEFAEVEALDECFTDDNKKFCTKKLKVGAKLTLPGFIKTCVDFLIEKTTVEIPDSKVNENDEAVMSSKAYSAQMAASGYSAKMAASGYSAKMAASGYSAKMAASGYSAKMAASGDYAQMAASGDYAKMAASGDSAKMAASGDYAKMAASGYSAQMAASGDSAKMAASGDSAKMAASGDSAKMAASGDSAKMAASGDSAKMECTGSDSVICCAGRNGRAKAKKGCWITLAEWEYSESKGRYVPVCVKTEFVDGDRIKEDTWYKIVNGEFIEA